MRTVTTLEILLAAIPEIEETLDYTFKDRSLLLLAFIHRSFLNENRMVVEHNERLEFFGDSILGMLVAEYLYRNNPTMSEGDLSRSRSRLVDATACVLYVQKLGLGDYLLLGKGERMNDGRGRESILADFLEALVAAVYLDGGIEAAKQFFFSHFLPDIEMLLEGPATNSKALLQEYSQKHFHIAPSYEVIEERGPDHSKTFSVVVKISGQEMGRGEGVSKKEAQQEAAIDALKRIPHGH